MVCASCSGAVERALAAVPRVAGCSVSVATEEALVRHAPGGAPPDAAALLAAVEDAGFEAELVRGSAARSRAGSGADAGGGGGPPGRREEGPSRSCCRWTG